MTPLTTKAAEIRAGLVAELRAACVGHPNASIAWPHRVLHQAVDLIEQQAAELDFERRRHQNTRDSRERWKVSTFKEQRRATTAESERDELLREKERLGAGWRPIETAPKDGTTFLAYQAEEGVDFFHWQDFGADSTAPKGWRDSFIHVYPEGSENGPKHWMPLPVPPAAEQEAV